MIVTHEPEDDIAYMVVAGFTDETDRNAGAAQWNDSIEYGTCLLYTSIMTVNADDAVTDFPPFKHFLFLYKDLSDGGKTLMVILGISE